MLEGQNQDPDYDEAAPPDRKRLKYLEENARSHLGERVKHILSDSFELEITQQHNQILEIDKCIAQVQQKLQVLRYVATRSYFSQKALQYPSSSLSPSTEMHPAVKSMLGKKPIAKMQMSTPSLPSGESSSIKKNMSMNDYGTLKIPRYIPPTLPEQLVAAPVRGELHCTKKKLIIGNISRWIPVSERDDTASHKWMVYVRGSREEPNVSSFVSQVVFFLHPSYAPHDVVCVGSHPFHVTRRGWGEFPLRIQVHFNNPLLKPVNIIHHLKLDRSYSGLQTLGAESIVDVMVYDSNHVRPSFMIANETMEEEEEFKPKSDGVCPEKLDILCGNMIPTSSDSISCEEMELNSPVHDPQMDRNVSIASASVSTDDKFKTKAGEGESCEQLEKIGEALNRDLPSLSINLTNDNTNQKEEIGANQSEIMTCDHDYFSTTTGFQPGTKKEPLVKNATQLASEVLNLPEQTKIVLSKALVPCSTTSISGQSQEKSKPVLVRCFNKNGTVLKLPLSLLRSAVIFQPFRTGKPGDSLLRPQPLPKTPETTPSVGKSSLNKIASTSSIKPDASRQEKIGVEMKFVHERQNLEEYLDTVGSNTWKCVRDFVRVLARNLRLIDIRAEDPVFRSVRPFSSSSQEIFSSWSIGKRRSAEWTRAKLIRSTLIKYGKNISSMETIWSTKLIMKWCRRQGYSPICCWSKPATNASLLSTAATCAEFQTLTETHLPSGNSVSEDDLFVEIEAPVESEIHSLPCGAQSYKATLVLNEPDPDVTTWIIDSIEKHGFKLGSEFHEDCCFSFSRILFSHIWKSVADDLVRRSLRETWQRNQGAVPDEISFVDTLNAITRRPQFDILTNAGLGVDEKTV